MAEARGYLTAYKTLPEDCLLSLDSGRLVLPATMDVASINDNANHKPQHSQLNTKDSFTGRHYVAASR